MTTLYRPVLIESAEQAEALPEGTVIIHADYYPQEKFDGLWGREGNSSESLAGEEGWSALVPVEAEERREYTRERMHACLSAARAARRDGERRDG